MRRTTGQNLIICLGFSITRRAARAIQERVRTKRANFLATESVNSSAPQLFFIYLFVCLFRVGFSTDRTVYLKRSYAKGKKKKERKEESN